LLLLGKNYDNAFYFSTVIRQNIDASFIQRWHVIALFPMMSQLRHAVL